MTCLNDGDGVHPVPEEATIDLGSTSTIHGKRHLESPRHLQKCWQIRAGRNTVGDCFKAEWCDPFYFTLCEFGFPADGVEDLQGF